jgi:hypothetical protein
MGYKILGVSEEVLRCRLFGGEPLSGFLTPPNLEGSEVLS